MTEKHSGEEFTACRSEMVQLNKQCGLDKHLRQIFLREIQIIPWALVALTKHNCT